MPDGSIYTSTSSHYKSPGTDRVIFTKQGTYCAWVPIEFEWSLGIYRLLIFNMIARSRIPERRVMMDSLPVKMIRMTSLDIDSCTMDCSRLKCCQCTGLDIKLLYIGRFHTTPLSEYHSRGVNSAPGQCKTRWMEVICSATSILRSVRDTKLAFYILMYFAGRSRRVWQRN